MKRLMNLGMIRVRTVTYAFWGGAWESPSVLIEANLTEIGADAAYAMWVRRPHTCQGEYVCEMSTVIEGSWDFCPSNPDNAHLYKLWREHLANMG